MRIVVFLSLLLAANAACLSAQATPPVQRMPQDSSKASPAGTRMGDHDRPSWTPVSYIVDSVLIGIAPLDTGSRTSTPVPWAMTSALDDDDIESIHVYKGESASKHGGCAGTSLIVITTKSRKWRPPAGAITGERSCTLPRS